MLGIGTTGGAWYSPFESIRPTVSSPPVVLFTFQMVTEFVPPCMESKNCWVVTTFTETVAGAIETLIFVTGSVHVDIEVVVEEVEVVVVQVIAVLGATYFLHEAKQRKAMSGTKYRRRFTAPLSSQPVIPDAYRSVSIMFPRLRNSILIPALYQLFRRSGL